ncbi:MAG: hypothetical protein LBI69_02865 [Puniceicoccales bacterium]|nr:hypothetical protein [Puniceicoccales bacterium]
MEGNIHEVAAEPVEQVPPAVAQKADEKKSNVACASCAAIFVGATTSIIPHLPFAIFAPLFFCGIPVPIVYVIFHIFGALLGLAVYLILS